MPTMTKMGALRITDPDGWKKQIKAAMAAAGGRIGDAAETLGVSSRQLFRWLALDGMSDIPRVEMGLPRDGRRGRKAKVKLSPKPRQRWNKADDGLPRVPPKKTQRRAIEKNVREVISGSKKKIQTRRRRKAS